MDLSDKSQFVVSEDEARIAAWQNKENKKKRSPFRRFFSALANIFTFGLYNKMKQAKAEQAGFYQAGNSEPEEEPVVEPVSQEDIAEASETDELETGEKQSAESDTHDKGDGKEEAPDENDKDSEERSL